MKHKSKDLKLRAILYYYKSKNQTQTSKIFGCSPRTLMRWVNKFNNYYSFSKNNKMYLGYKLARVRRIVGFLPKIHRLVLDFLVHSLEAYYGNVWSCLDIKNINGSIL
jgi:hypothetical protein